MEVAVYEEKGESKGEDAEVSRWLSEIELAYKSEKGWRDEAEQAILAYRSKCKPRAEDSDTKETFNILWANVETKRQAVYSQVPRPDIRRRYRDKDLVGKAVSEVLERCVSYTMDCQDFDTVLIAAANDMLLPGRAVTRLKYVATMTESQQAEETPESEDEQEASDPGNVEYEEIVPEQVQWDDFIRGPGKSWDEVTWIAFRHRLTKAQIKEKFPKFADVISYDVMGVGEGTNKDTDDSDKTVFKRACVYEIWDKDDRKVRWVAKSYKDSFLDVMDDPLELKGFWPIASPLTAVESSVSLIPICEYSQYRLLAEELDKICKRRTRLADALRVRGVYDSTLAEMSQIFDSGDNEFIAAEELSRLIENGGLEKFIWMLPIDKLIVVYQVLGQQRAELIQQIYEITGISDIIRGQTNPNETLGAQQMKANFGSLRIDRQRKSLEKYARDLVRIMVELISEKFSRETLTLMSGLSFPTNDQKMQAQMAIQMMQQQMQGMPPEMQQQMQAQMGQQMQQAQQILSQPSWEDIESVLKSDLSREYRIDVETDSTVMADAQRDQQIMAEFMNGMGQFFKFASDGINTGMISPEISRKIMGSFVRKFKLGRDVEDEIENFEPPQQNQAQQQAQAEQQAKAQEAQAKAQAEQAKTQAQLERIQAELQADRDRAEIERVQMQAELQLMAEKLELKRQEVVVDRQKLADKAQYEQIVQEQKIQETKDKG